MASEAPSPPSPSPPPSASPEPELAQLRRKVEKLERELRSCRRQVREVEKLLQHTERLYRSAESDNQELRTQVRGCRGQSWSKPQIPVEPVDQCQPIGLDSCLRAGENELRHGVHGLDRLSYWQWAHLFGGWGGEGHIFCYFVLFG